MSLVHKKITVVLDLTEYDASLLVGLVEREARQARELRSWVSMHGPGGEPLRGLSTWERIAVLVASGVAKAAIHEP